MYPHSWSFGFTIPKDSVPKDSIPKDLSWLKQQQRYLTKFYSASPSHPQQTDLFSNSGCGSPAAPKITGFPAQTLQQKWGTRSLPPNPSLKTSSKLFAQHDVRPCPAKHQLLQGKGWVTINARLGSHFAIWMVIYLLFYHDTSNAMAAISEHGVIYKISVLLMRW